MNWKELINIESQKDYYKYLVSFIQNDAASYTIYPDHKKVFEAFNLCAFDKTKVVLLAQDPYHGPNQAHGLSLLCLAGNSQAS
jgi:uracil-DNA glycosylase